MLVRIISDGKTFTGAPECYSGQPLVIFRGFSSLVSCHIKLHHCAIAECGVVVFL